MGLGLPDVPREHKHLAVFAVYRPAELIKDFSEKLAHVPVKVGHENWLSSPDDPRAIGMTGGVNLKMLDGEVVVTSTLDIKDSADVIFSKDRELSPGYKADYHWQSGTSPNGETFQIICDKILEVNHVAVVPEARGGSEMRVLDGGKGLRKWQSSFFQFIKNAMKKTNDGMGDTDAFILMLEDVKKCRHIWNEEEFNGHVNSLIGMVSSLPDSEDKEKLKRFLLDVPLFRDEDEATVDCAIATLQDFYFSLNRDAISNEMEKSMVDGDKKPENGQPSVTNDQQTTGTQTVTNDQQPAGTQNAEQKTADGVPPENKDGGTADETKPDVNVTNNKEQTSPTNDEVPLTTTVEPPRVASLEDVLAAISALTVKIDAVLGASCKTGDTTPPANTEGTSGDTQPETQKSEPEKQTNDSMPLYTQVTGSNTVNAGNALDDVFAKMKGRM